MQISLKLSMDHQNEECPYMTVRYSMLYITLEHSLNSGSLEKLSNHHTYAKLIQIKLLYLEKRHGLHEYVGKMESNYRRLTEFGQG